MAESIDRMNRRQFLATCSVPAFAQSGIGYPEEQHPQSPRGSTIAEAARSLRIRRGVKYVHRPEGDQTLDIYSPGKAASPALPAILYPGLAAWKKNEVDFRRDLDRIGDSSTPTLYPPILATRGYVVVAVSLRTSAEAKFPAQIHDYKCAVRWVRQNARSLGVDPDRIGLYGHGSLNALLAVTADTGKLDDPSCSPEIPVKVQAVCAGSGMFDFELYARDPGDGTMFNQIEPYLGVKRGQEAEILRVASPAQYVHRGLPPFMLIHGVQDRRVPYSQTPHFARLLKENGVEVQIVAIKDHAHGPIPGKLGDPGYAEIDRLIYEFFDRHLH